MLNRSAKISGRPYVRLTFELRVGVAAPADVLRAKLIDKLKASPWMLLVGEPERSVSSAFVGGTTVGFGRAYIDATVRYLGSADGMTYDATLRPFDKAITDFLGEPLVTLKDAGIIGTTLSTNAPVGMKTAQELAQGSASPAKKVVDAITEPLDNLNDTTNYLSWAVIAGAVAFLVWKGEPIAREIGKVFQRARK